MYVEGNRDRVLQISASTMKSILQTGVIREETSQVYRNPVRQRLDGWQEVCLNDEQMNAVASIWAECGHLS